MYMYVNMCHACEYVDTYKNENVCTYMYVYIYTHTYIYTH